MNGHTDIPMNEQAKQPQQSRTEQTGLNLNGISSNRRELNGTGMGKRTGMGSGHERNITEHNGAKRTGVGRSGGRRSKGANRLMNCHSPSNTFTERTCARTLAISLTRARSRAAARRSRSRLGLSGNGNGAMGHEGFRVLTNPKSVVKRLAPMPFP